jgi:hypothetical protein
MTVSELLALSVKWEIEVMLKSNHLAFLLAALVSTGPALAHDCRCYDTRGIRPCAPHVGQSGNAVGYRGYPPLRNASPQDPSGTIVLEGAAGAGAPNGD